jgi:hypothetical protein
MYPKPEASEHELSALAPRWSLIGERAYALPLRRFFRTRARCFLPAGPPEPPLGVKASPAFFTFAMSYLGCGDVGASSAASSR